MRKLLRKIFIRSIEGIFYKPPRKLKINSSEDGLFYLVLKFSSSMPMTSTVQCRHVKMELTYTQTHPAILLCVVRWQESFPLSFIRHHKYTSPRTNRHCTFPLLPMPCAYWITFWNEQFPLRNKNKNTILNNSTDISYRTREFSMRKPILHYLWKKKNEQITNRNLIDFCNFLILNEIKKNKSPDFHR